MPPGLSAPRVSANAGPALATSRRYQRGGPYDPTTRRPVGVPPIAHRFAKRDRAAPASTRCWPCRTVAAPGVTPHRLVLWLRSGYHMNQAHLARVANTHTRRIVALVNRPDPRI